MLRYMGISSIVLLLIHLGCVGADYIFEARLQLYQNPTHAHSLPDGTCCDGVANAMGVCTDSCDNIFTFCIQESSATGSSLALPLCPFLRRVSGVFQDNDDISFDEDLGNGVSNPLTFSRSGAWPGGVRFVARSRESDPAGPIIVTLFAIVNISAESDFITVIATSPQTLMITITVSFRVMCTGSFMGPDCSMCREGFTGDSCDIDLDPCVPTSPCQNGGTCTSPGPDQFECRCVEGYEGMNCELMTDECSPNPCLNGGTCVDLFLDYECDCAAGHEGMNCSRETDECVPNPCINGGTCMDLLADYSCSCVSGFTGRNCEMVEEEAASSFVSPTVIVGTVVTVALVAIIVILVLGLVAVLVVKRRQKTVTVTGGGSQQDTMEIKPNPGYGISLQQTPPAETGYVNEGLGPKCNEYAYVRTTASIPTKSNPAYTIPVIGNPQT